jgi:adenylate cyclase
MARAPRGSGRRRGPPPTLARLALALLLALAGWGLQALGIFDPVDRRLLDWAFLARGEHGRTSPVVLVAIDDESLYRVGRRWPWPRAVHAELIRRLAAAQVRVVGFDVLFIDPDPDYDRVLGEAAEAAGNVVWASTFASEGQLGFRLAQLRKPAAALDVPGTAIGYADLWFDPDGYIRRFSPVHQVGEQIFKSFGLAVAERYRRSSALYITAGGTRWGRPAGPRVPVEPDGTVRINFAGPPASFPILSYVRVLEGEVPAAALRDAVVLVGSTAFTVDNFFTPFYSRVLPETRRLMPGVEIHANVVDMLLHGDFVQPLAWPWRLLVFVGLGLVAFAATDARWWIAVGAFLLTVGTVAVLGVVAFAGTGLWAMTGGPLTWAPVLWAGLILYGFVRERREKAFVRSVLDVYVSPAVIREIIEGDIDLALGGQRRPLSILFADVHGFTGLSERVAPEEVVRILGRFFARASRIVLGHDGTLDKFIGDAVMAFWGAPADHPDHAVRAVRAALEMQAAARELDGEVQARYRERFTLGIGINSGEAVVGHIGSPERMGYTAVGDPVNVAARVEAMSGDLGAEIVITQSTYDLVRFQVEAEALGFHPVRGRHDPVALYRVRGLKEETVDDTDGT